MDKILLFIPSYNCAQQIPRVLNQLDKELMQYITKIIVVNNRSTDNTEDVVLKYVANKELPLTILRNDENYGLGGSHKVAFDYALNNKFDYIIVLHGDDQGDIQDILPLLKSGEYRSFDCCLGARFMKDSKLKGYSGFRTFGNRVYNWVFTVSTGKRIYDLGSGLNLYKTDILTNRFFYRFSDNLMFNCYMLLANSAYKLNVKFFPISWREDDQVSNVRLFSQAMKTLKIAGGYFFSGNKSEYLKRDFRNNKVLKYTAKSIKK
ncbi:family 2 glycosyl transferase [Paenibacillus sp. FSL R7-269]|uniref:glycosyltransferase family 2 protein n=1 Tax=Paenibacillus sp. FSL R7-269 TaxID=1226755 RepID=UPI0003E27D7F|nr:glycosyltransferase family 2 protein [Paenibacillus sp. FSL R7-269]ETT50049.1 family 2 glycosyl transferase [Paenibacillus sp. FSL R7-269]